MTVAPAQILRHYSNNVRVLLGRDFLKALGRLQYETYDPRSHCLFLAY